MATANDIKRLQEEVGDLLATHSRARSLDSYSKYADDPVGFIRHELGGRPWQMQEEIALLIRDHRYVVVRSSNGQGKDWLSARLALWWVYARKGMVLITGPTERQVKQVVMGEVRRAFQKADRLPGDLYELALRIDGPEQMGVLAFTSTDASKLTGFHAPRLMVVITEAQGVEELVWEGAFSNVTGAESRILAVGNPLQPSGKFFEVSRSPNWKPVRISAFDHPNVVEGREVVPGAVTRDFVELMKSEYGEGSGVYQSRVLGEFPDEADDVLCQRAWIRAANERWLALKDEPRDTSAPVVFALDPARYGPDESVLAIRRGDVIEEIVTWRKLSTMETAGRVQLEAGNRGLSLRGGAYVARRDGAPPEADLWIDEPGLGGGVIDRLVEQGIRVDAYNGGHASKKPETFRNLRAQTYWHLRQLLETNKIALPPDEKLADELCATRWKVASDGRVEIEPKDDLRKRLGRSPDRADAVVMALAGNFRARLLVA